MLSVALIGLTGNSSRVHHNNVEMKPKCKHTDCSMHYRMG